MVPPSTPIRAPIAAALTMTSGPDAPRAAREFVHVTAESWHLEAVVPTLDLAVSELVTNAVVHGEGPVRLKLIRRPGSLIVEVYDEGRRRPTLRRSSMSDYHGRGIGIVASLSEGWGVVRSRQGKIVWCSIAC